uniref:F-box domain-containing protein n=1 Tax=Globodera rostochiensis TaxID=31243 RepID=A0A914GPU3_GLORO
MSDNASEPEQQQQMQEIWLHDDIWFEVFAYIDPFELGLKMALISNRLDVLVDVHFKSRKWSLGWLRIIRSIFNPKKWSLSCLKIRRATDGNGAQIVKRSAKRFGERLPIPQVPLPINVIGFKKLEIRYVDQTVVEFLQRICRLFNSSGTTVDIGTFYDQSRSWEIIRQKIWPLVNDNICRFFVDFSQLDRLRQFSPTVLRNCPKLRSINSDGHFPEFPAQVNAGASSAQAVAKWLVTPRGDGLPKMFHCCGYSSEMDGLKEAFVNASESVKNNWTGERLALRQMDKDNWLLVRCPIGRDERKWAKWEEEAIGWAWIWWWRQWNWISIDFSDRDIGVGMFKGK